MTEDAQNPAQPTNASAPKGRQRYRSAGRRNQDQALADWFEYAIPDDVQDPQSMEQLLEKVLAKIPAKATAWDPDDLRAIWQRAAGEFISSQTELVSLSGGVATVRMLQPAMRYHLMQWQNAILDKLRKESGLRTLNSVRFLIG